MALQTGNLMYFEMTYTTSLIYIVTDIFNKKIIFFKFLLTPHPLKKKKE